jgi:methylmalonyl-CoA/ethylmalonyl-CoA epimerase
MTRVDHIGIIVADLDAAVAKLGVLFGEAKRKELPDVGLRIAEFHAQNVTIELLEYASNADFARRVMGERIGLNHLSLAVRDADRSIDELKRAGFRPMAGFPRQGAHGRVAFFEPESASGLLFEVCQPDG